MDAVESMQEQMTIFKDTEILRKQKILDIKSSNRNEWLRKLWAREYINNILKNWKAKRIKTEKQNRREYSRSMG